MADILELKKMLQWIMVVSLDKRVFVFYISKVDFLGPSLQTLLDIAESFQYYTSLLSQSPHLFSS